MTRKNSQSVYNFKVIKTGDTFLVSKTKVISMKNSLRRYNKAHDLDISIEYEPFDDNGVEKLRVLCTNGAVALTVAI